MIMARQHGQPIKSKWYDYSIYQSVENRNDEKKNSWTLNPCLLLKKICANDNKNMHNAKKCLIMKTDLLQLLLGEEKNKKI